MASKTPVAIIYTEGKTDWKHLKKAQETLNINLPVVFHESETSLGSAELLNLCQYLAKREDNGLPGICIFDRDEPPIIKKVTERNKSYKNWDNKFFSFTLPIPEHRQGYDDNICIEFYYADDEIKTRDEKGRRLFLSTEFKEPSGRHKSQDNLLLGRKQQSKITDDVTKAKILDADVFNQNDSNVALTKDDFAENISKDIIPFTNFKFEAFRKIFDIIEEIIHNEIIPKMQPEQEETLPPKFFIGREAQFAEFEKYLKRNKPISIEGLGGIGKTTFAEKCIEKFQFAEKAVWFPCTRESTIDALIEIAGFPDLLKIEKLTELAKYSGFATLIERNEKILFLDDFQEVVHPSFAKFLQFADRKQMQKAKIVLIAREHPEIGVLTSPIHLEGLDNNCAVQYAKQILASNFPELTVSDEILDEICQKCKGHPLGIELSIHLLSVGTPPDDIFHAIVEYGDEEFLANRLLNEIFDHPKTTPQEKELMCVFSVFLGKVRESAINALFAGEYLSSTLRILRRKLMLMHTDDFYETHPLVREFCYDRLENKQVWHQKAAEYFKTERSEKFDPVLEETIYYHLVESKQWQEIADFICAQGEQFILTGYIDILDAMLDKAKTQIEQSPKFYNLYGKIAAIKGDLISAFKYFTESLKLYQEINDKPGISTALNNLGTILQDRGDLQGAWEKYHTSLTLYDEIGDKAGIAGVLSNLGSILRDRGDLQGAWDKQQASLTLYEEIGNKTGIAVSLNNLGYVLRKRGEFQDAWKKYQASLMLCEEIGYKEGIATSLNNLGVILRNIGDFQGAWEKHQASLMLCEEIGDKTKFATSLDNLGYILRVFGDLQGAWDKHQTSLTMYEEIGNKIGIATSLNNLGYILLARGDSQGAWDKYQASLMLCEEMGDKAGIAIAFNNLGGILQDHGDLQGAWDKYQASLMLCEEMGDKAGIASAFNNLGRILQERRESSSAWEKYRASLSLCEEMEDKTGIAVALNNLGCIFLERNELSAAWENYQRSLALQEEMGDKAGIAITLNNLGRILQERGELQYAWKKYQMSLTLRKEIGDKAGIVNSFHNMGSLACQQKNYILSLQYLLHAQAIYNQTGIKNQEIAQNIGEIRKQLGFQHFKIAVKEAFAQLPEELQPYVKIEEFMADTTIQQNIPKVGRNDPCPCGSGKKYKKCHGR